MHFIDHNRFIFIFIFIIKKSLIIQKLFSQLAMQTITTCLIDEPEMNVDSNQMACRILI